MEDPDQDHSFMAEQMSDVITGTIINNIKLYMKILESNKVDKTILKSSYAEYLTRCKSSGIPMPKVRSKIDLSRLPKKLSTIYHQIDTVDIMRKSYINPELDTSTEYMYKGFPYYTTNNPYYDGEVLCADKSGRIMLRWDSTSEQEIPLTAEDIQWLIDNGYRVHPAFVVSF